MIREYLGRKVAKKIDRTKFGDTKAGKISAVLLDDGRLDDIGHDYLNSLAENQNHPYLLNRIFVLTIVINLISWLPVFLIPSAVSRLVLAFSFIFSKGGMLLLLPVGGFTIIGVYSLLRIWFPERSFSSVDGPIMQSYGRDSESLLTWKLWLVASGSGGINAILLYAAYVVMTGEYEYYERVGEFPWDLYF